jgi:hypothetical protein
MDTLQRRLRYVAACGLFGTAVAAVLATGCSSDDNGGGPDAAADHTTDVTMEVGQQQETSLQDQSHPDAPADSTTDAPADVAVADASDSGDSSPAADASDGATVDAHEGGIPGCTTTVASLGGTTPDAGDAAVPRILFSFDDATDAGIDTTAWSVFNDTGSTATALALNPLDGHPCAGSATTTATYTAYGPKVQVYYNYNSNVQNWTGYTTFHVWLKVVTTDFTTIQGIEPLVQSSNYTFKHFDGFVSGATLSDGGWHETIVHLTPGGDYDPATVNAFQLELQTVPSGADGGPLVPPPATLLIDSIWIE